MKFELMDLPEPEAPGAALERPEEALAPDGDPIAGIHAATGRLAEQVRAEGERIDASLAELTAAVSRKASTDARRVRPARTATRPPDNFRADRFTGESAVPRRRED